MLVGTVENETLNIIDETVSTYNIFKGRIFEEVNKGTTCALGSEIYINQRTHFCCIRIFIILFAHDWNVDLVIKK